MLVPAHTKTVSSPTASVFPFASPKSCFLTTSPASDLKEHTAGSSTFSRPIPSSNFIPLTILCPFFLGPGCRDPPLHLILLVRAITPVQEVCLDPVPVSLHVDHYPSWPHVVHRFPPAQQLLEQAVLTVFVLMASAQSTRLPVPALTDFSISFLVRAS